MAQHMPVRTEMLPREEAGKLVDLGRLPAHLEGEEELMVRIVTVGDYDICPCIGEHVEIHPRSARFGWFRTILPRRRAMKRPDASESASN